MVNHDGFESDFIRKFNFFFAWDMIHFKWIAQKFTKCAKVFYLPGSINWRQSRPTCFLRKGVTVYGDNFTGFWITNKSIHCCMINGTSPNNKAFLRSMILHNSHNTKHRPSQPSYLSMGIISCFVMISSHKIWPKRGLNHKIFDHQSFTSWPFLLLTGCVIIGEQNWKFHCSHLLAMPIILVLHSFKF